MENFDIKYEKAMSGDAKAFKELKAGAEVGNPEAQNLLSCLYGNMDSPFYDEKQYDYWQNKLEQNDCTESQKELPLNDYIPNWVFYKYPSYDDLQKPQSLFKILFSSKGRLSRSEYICVLVLTIAIHMLLALGCTNSYIAVSQQSLFLYGFIIYYPLLNAAIKRCHDIGTTGLNLIIPFYFIYIMFVKGNKGENEYGPDPLESH